MKKNDNQNSLKDIESQDNTFLSLFENSLYAIVLGVPDGTILEANGAALEMFGYSLEELRGLGRKIIFDHEDSVMQSSLKVRATEGKAKGVLIGIRKNGERFPCEFSSAIFQTESGEQRTSTVLIDITERRKAEEEIALLLDNTEECFVLLNRQLEIISFNKKFKSTYEIFFDKSVSKGLSIFDFAREDRKKPLEAIYKSVFSGLTVDEEVVVFDNGQEKIVFHSRFKPAFDREGLIMGVFVTSRNITEKININQQKEIERKDKEALINSTDDLIWSVNADFSLMAGNTAFTELMYRYSNYTVKRGENVLDGNFFAKEFILFWKNLYERALTGETLKQEICSPEKENIGTLWFETNLNPIFDGTQIVGVACFGRNITDKKSAQLEREQIISELLQINKDLKQFSYVTSHNLRAPIANLLGLTNLIDHYKVDDPSLKQILEGIKQSALMFDETVKDLSKVLIIKDQSNALKEQISLEHIVNKTLKQLGIKSNNEEITINFNFKISPFVTFTGSYLESIFINLFTNAIKYKSNKRPLKIDIISQNTLEHTIVTFTDNGIGIDLTKYGDKIFNLYQRFHENSEGKGLGLYLIRSQLEALGSTINVESEVGSGTSFILKFRNEE
ncbi:MAG: PAS domain-containing sensor histidine kinase [Bacteroidota bacterium]